MRNLLEYPITREEKLEALHIAKRLIDGHFKDELGCVYGVAITELIEEQLDLLVPENE